MTPWQASNAYVVGHQILSPKLHLEVVTKAGTSAATAPTWTNTAGLTVSDGSVTWLDQGAITAIPLSAWIANNPYTSTRILDSNGNVEIVGTAGTSGATTPAWSTTPGGTTVDGTVTWINGGTMSVNGLQASGGASSIIMDNVVPSGTLAGASQVYFSTLANQTCTSGGTGGCAVQASQAGLK